MRTSSVVSLAGALCVLALVASACGGSAASPGGGGTVPPPGASGTIGAPAPTGGATAQPPTSSGPGATTQASAATGAAPGSWTSGSTNASTNEPIVACGTPTFCLNPPNVWNGTTWAAMASQPSLGPAKNLVCLPSSHCLGITDDNFTTWDGSKWTVGKNFYQVGTTQGGVSITSISCPTETFCAAVDFTYGYAFTWNGSKWSDPVSIDPAAAASTVAVNAGKSYDLDEIAVSCASPTFCAAVDTVGNATTFDGSTWSKPVQLSTQKQNQLVPPLACPSPTYCISIVGGGYSTWNGTAWSPVATDAPPGYPANAPAFQAVSCASADFCMAVGTPGNSDWGIFSGATFTPGTANVGIQQPSAVSCPTIDFCMTVGPYNVATWHR